jgi:hydrogenase-4 component F
VGPEFLRAALLAAGLTTLVIAALLLTVTGDLKRMLAYSSMETMGLIAVAAAAGTQLAIAALLLHVTAHGVGKTVLFLAGGQLQAAHGTTTIREITAVLGRSRLIGGAFAAGMVVLLGLPPFAMFASEVVIAISLADARLSWALGVALVALVVAFAALLRNSGRILLGTPSPDSPAIGVPMTVAGALIAGVALSLALGITAGPLSNLFSAAASQLGVR